MIGFEANHATNSARDRLFRVTNAGRMTPAVEVTKPKMRCELFKSLALKIIRTGAWRVKKSIESEKNTVLVNIPIVQCLVAKWANTFEGEAGFRVGIPRDWSYDAALWSRPGGNRRWVARGVTGPNACWQTTIRSLQDSYKMRLNDVTVDGLKENDNDHVCG